MSERLQLVARCHSHVLYVRMNRHNCSVEQFKMQKNNNNNNKRKRIRKDFMYIICNNILWIKNKYALLFLFMWRIICVLYGCNLGERAEWRANSGIFTVDDVDDDDDGRWLMYATAAVSDNNYLFMVRSYVCVLRAWFGICQCRSTFHFARCHLLYNLHALVLYPTHLQNSNFRF